MILFLGVHCHVFFFNCNFINFDHFPLVLSLVRPMMYKFYFFAKQQFIIWPIFLYLFCYQFYYFSNINYFFPPANFDLIFLVLECIVRSFVWCFSIFLIRPPIAINFPLNNVLPIIPLVLACCVFILINFQDFYKFSFCFWLWSQFIQKHVA